jgi:protein TonB
MRETISGNSAEAFLLQLHESTSSATMESAPLTVDLHMPEVTQPSANPNARFMAGSVPHGADERVRFGNSFLVSAVTHVGGALLIAFIISRMPAKTIEYTPPDRLPDGIIWTQSVGPGGGGGGGGNRSPEPVRKAELPGKQKVTVPVEKAPKITPEPPKTPPKPETQMNIPAVTTSAGVQELPGALSGLPSLPSLGTGTGTGAGTGKGSGIGSGTGSGFGEGSGGGTGGGAYRPGNGVTMPALLSDPKPNYTAEAMRAKIQGVVMVEAVVLADGGVGQVRVIRSLDPTFGLDQEALKTVRKWRFRPGMRQGQAVPVIVEIELTFTLR